MYNLEQILFHAKNNNYKWCEVFDNDGLKVYSLTNNDSNDKLIDSLKEFFANSPHGKYSINFKASKTTNADSIITNKLNYSSNETQLQGTKNQSQQLDIEAVTAKIYKQVKAEHEAELRQKSILEKEKELDSKLKELNGLAGKANFILETFFDKIIQKFNPLSTAQLAGTNTPNNMANTEPIQLTTEEQQELTIAIQKFLSVTDVATLTLFANKVAEKPQIIEQLKSFL